MQQQQIKLIKNKLKEWMHKFDMENRNNRLSSCMVAGMGGFLENLIFEIIREVEKDKDEHVDLEKINKV